jgi:hypothetical protein
MEGGRKKGQHFGIFGDPFCVRVYKGFTDPKLLRKYQIIPYTDLFNNFFYHNKSFLEKMFIYQGWKQPLLALLHSNN